MPRYIDADLILPEMESKFDMQELYLPIHFQEFIVDEIPSADVSPVRHGYWKRELMSSKIGLYGYICSNCNKLIYVGKERYMTYCGNCGAKMDGKERDEND